VVYGGKKRAGRVVLFPKNALDSAVQQIRNRVVIIGHNGLEKPALNPALQHTCLDQMYRKEEFSGPV
jgi:hypothetical protein